LAWLFDGLFAPVFFSLPRMLVLTMARMFDLATIFKKTTDIQKKKPTTTKKDVSPRRYVQDFDKKNFSTNQNGSPVPSGCGLFFSTNQNALF